jgi:hypothetical protein
MKQSKSTQTKLTKEPVTIDSKDLVEGGTYMTHTKDIVQIRGIDKIKKELHLYNITHSCNVYVKIITHQLIKRIR